MTNLRTLSAAAARLTAGTSLSTAPAAPQAQQPAAPAAGTEEVVDVVTVTDAQAAVASARAEGVTEGAKAETARMNAVFESDAGKANLSMAAWMLTNNPSASADSIVSKLAAMPGQQAQASTQQPAPAAETAKPLSVDLSNTPKMEVQPNANAGEAEQSVDADKFWKTHLDANAAAATPTMLAPGLPATGN